MAQEATAHNCTSENTNLFRGIKDNTVWVAQLKLLHIGAKLVFHNNRD